MFAAVQAADVDQQIRLTWIAAQDLQLILDCTSCYAAEQQLHRWFTHCADAGVPELPRLARTADAWGEELLAYFDTVGASNGPTEATNGLIKKIKRSGHGFRSLDNYRLQLLLHRGADWQAYNQRVRGWLPC